MSRQNHPLRHLLLVSAFFATFGASTARAQTPYVVTHSNGTYVPITGGTVHPPIAYGGFTAQDEGSAAISLPFTFIWYGQNYNTIHAYTNGLVSFSPPPATLAGQLRQPSVVPNPGNLLHNFIGVMWHDLTADASSAIRSLVTGTAGSRVVTIQFEGYRGFNNPLAEVNFQVRLFEGTNGVQVVMGPNNSWSAGNGGTTAIENATGTDGLNLMDPSPTCSAACACAPSRCGSLNWVVGHTIDIDLPMVPELTATISAPPGARVNTMFDVDVDIFNSGLNAAAAFNYEIYLTPTDTSTLGGTRIGLFSVPGLAPASSISRMHTLTVPPGFPVGRFFVAVKVDTGGVITEAREDNNSSFSGEFGTGPDLTGNILAPSDSGPGEPLPINFSVRSLGAPVVMPVGVQLYLSTMPTFDMMTAIPLGPAMITLADGFRFTGTVTVTMPVSVPPSPPRYYVVAVLDDQDNEVELDETNNVLISAATINVRGPDLAGVTFVGGMFGFRGQTYPLTATIQNIGGARAIDFTVCIYLSDNMLISVTSDTQLLETQPMTIQPGETRALTLEPTIPAMTTPGPWYIAAVLDCGEQVPEALETNNTLRRLDPIMVRDPSPDFAPISIQSADNAAAAETTPVTVDYGNIGNASGAATVRIVLSTNPGISADDTLLFETPMPTTLAPSQRAALAEWVPIPADTRSGTYYIGAYVDPDDQADETFEDNNTIASNPIVITGTDLAIVTPRPPNAIFGVPYTRRFAAVGGMAAYTWSVEWTNGGPPTGMTFDTTTAELSGTPDMSAEGLHAFDLTVTSGTLFATRRYELIVSGPTIPLTVVSSRLPPALSKEPYSIQLVAVGGTPPYRWALLDPPPFGLGLASDGIFGGEPQIVDSRSFRVRVEDATMATVDGLLSVDVVDPTVSVSIQQADVAAGIANVPYETEFSVAGGRAPFAWRLEGGPVPGLTFAASSAMLTGTPTVAGDYPIVVEVRDADGLIDRNAYVLEIAPEGVLRILTGTDADNTLPAATLGKAYVTEDGSSVRLRATEPSGVTWSIVSGALPPGLELAGSSGIISGTPTNSGSYAFVAFARSQGNDTRRAALAIVVNDPDAAVPGAPEPSCSCRTTHRGDGAAWWLVLLPIWLFRRRTRGLLAMMIVVGAVSTVSTASAQEAPYRVFMEAAPYASLGPSAIEISPGLGDGGTVPIQLPFAVVLYGEPYSTLQINANGWASVVTSALGYHTPASTNPEAMHPNGYYAPLWADWCASSNGCVGVANPGMGIFYQIDPTPGRGSITIEWRSVRHFADDVVPSNVDFQLTLHEGTQALVEMRYGPAMPGTNVGGGNVNFQARIGIESPDGSRGMFVGPCTGASPCSTFDVQSLTNHKISIIADGGEDLTLSGVGSESSGFAGLPLSVSASLSSRHFAPIGPFRISAFLLPAAATSTVGATPSYESAPITLAGFESRVQPIRLEVPIDTMDGEYRVAVVVDGRNEVAETNEANNLQIASTIVTIGGRAPDFRAKQLRLITLVGAPGGSIDLTYTFENFGNEPATLQYQLVLSENDAITPSDVLLGGIESVPLAPREVHSATVSIALPSSMTTGRYILGALLDPNFLTVELDESNNIARSAVPIVVASSEVQILTTSLPPATFATAYEVRLEAAGGSGQYTWAIASGTLPRGVAFDTQTGRLYGVPLEAGVFELTIRIDSEGATTERALTFTVLETNYALTLLTRSLPTGTLGFDYAVAVEAVGGQPPYRYRTTDGTLPEGIVMAPDGTIFGTPNRSGFSLFTVEVRDDATATATVTLALEVRSPGNLTISSFALPDATLGEPYIQSLFASGGQPPLQWVVLTETPPGMVVASEGAVNGIPERVDDYRFAVQVTDALGKTDTALLRLTVKSDDRFRIVTMTIPTGAPGEPYSATIVPEGGERPFTCTVLRREGFLPPGFESTQDVDGMTTDELVITGTPEREGVWPFSVQCTDRKNRSDEAVYALVVKRPAPVDMPDEGGCGCSATKTRRSPWALAFSIAILLGVLRRDGLGARIS